MTVAGGLPQPDIDERYLRRCLALADRHRGRTAPNPLVGCVIVGADGTVLAEGAHAGAGTAHAEIVALGELARLGRSARGATLYVNLEPCNHHGRTPPCAPVVRDAGVARVVIGMADPIPSHAGGIAVLTAAGIAVTVGVIEDACRRHNRGFLAVHTLGRPAFTLKAAITLDGKIATISGQSQWITGPEARDDGMRLRDQSDAVMVGVGTLLADNPRLTVRRLQGGNAGHQPIRIVADSQLRTPHTAHVLAGSTGVKTIILASLAAPAEREAALVALGADVVRVSPRSDGRIDLKHAAARLAERGILDVLVEGGGELHAALLADGLVDELVLYIAPKIVGGPAKSWVGGAGIGELASAYQLAFDPDPVQLGADLRLTASPCPPRGDRDCDNPTSQLVSSDTERFRK